MPLPFRISDNDPRFEKFMEAAKTGSLIDIEIEGQAAKGQVYESHLVMNEKGVFLDCLIEIRPGTKLTS
jgi:hypothetical protein